MCLVDSILIVDFILCLKTLIIRISYLISFHVKRGEYTTKENKESKLKRVTMWRQSFLDLQGKYFNNFNCFFLVIEGQLIGSKEEQ